MRADELGSRPSVKQVSSVTGLAGWALAALGWVAVMGVVRLLSVRADAVRRCCHEVRGPLTAVRLGIDLEARTGGVAPKRQRAIELELEQATVALEDLTRTCAGPVPALWRGFGCREEVELGGLLADCVEAAQGLAAACGAELRMRWVGKPAHIAADRRRLAQAIGNLIANALEHGAGPVQVTGRADGQAVRIEVTDAGMGLAAPVAQLMRRRRRDGGRRGHGLSIAAAVAADHGGRLAAAPSQRGARLVLELPVSAPDRAISAGG